MSAFRPGRSKLLPRLLALWLLLCGVLVAPLAAALGDVHALGHADAAGHVHDHGDDAAGDDDGADDDGLLHALMQGGHCHGHASVIMPGGFPACAASLAATMPPVVLIHYRSLRPNTLLRPPIARCA